MGNFKIDTQNVPYAGEIKRLQSVGKDTLALFA